MKRKLIVSLAASILLSYSGLSLAATYSPTVTNGHKIWLQPTLTANADSIDGGGWTWATNDDLYTLFRSYFGGGVFTYTGAKNTNTYSPEANGAYYYSGASSGFFDVFEPQYQNERYFTGSGIFNNYLYAETTNSIGSVLIDEYYQVSYIGDSGGGTGTSLKWLYKVNPVPIPAAAFLFAPALLGFIGLRRKAKNSVA